MANIRQHVDKWIFPVAVAVFLLFPGSWLHRFVYASAVLVFRCVATGDCDLTLLFFQKWGKSPTSLKGRVVWVTGASSGLGEELAVHLARAGAKVVISARNEENLERVRKRCVAASIGGSDDDIFVLPLDILQYNTHQEALDQVLKQFGKLDILVSNAGRSQRARWEMIDTDVDKELFELNVFSLMSLARIVTLYFIENGGGHHVVTSSVAGKFGVPLSASYTSSKHALQGMFDTYRMEKNDGKVSITMLCAGPVDSNLLRECFMEAKGEKLGAKRGGKKMSADRFAELSMVAIANKVAEAWISNPPVLGLVYACQYCPTITKSALNFIGLNNFQNVRDGRGDIGTPEGLQKFYEGKQKSS